MLADKISCYSNGGVITEWNSHSRQDYGLVKRRGWLSLKGTASKMAATRHVLGVKYCVIRASGFHSKQINVSK